MNGILLGIMVSAIVFYVIFGICLFRNAKHQNDEDKNKMDGQLLGRGDLQEEEVGIQYSEQPFFGSIESYN